MTRNNVVLRDFVYLDWERVRSLAAQLFRGVPESATAEKGSEAEAEGDLEGSAFGLLKGKLRADYRYFRTESETRSFHHYIYSLVEDQLLKDGLLTPIDANFDFNKWTEGFLRDGQFVRVIGMVRLMDFAWISAWMGDIHKMISVIQNAETLKLERMKNDQLVTLERIKDTRKKQREQLDKLKAMKTEGLKDFVRQLYGNVVRVKVVPDRHHLDKVFVGSGDPANFYDTAASLAQKYGYEIDAGWVTLGQINQSVVSDEPLPIPIGNRMEDAVERVAISMNRIIRVASAPKFPVVSFTPISIYRIC